MEILGHFSVYGDVSVMYTCNSSNVIDIGSLICLSRCLYSVTKCNVDFCVSNLKAASETKKKQCDITIRKEHNP